MFGDPVCRYIIFILIKLIIIMYFITFFKSMLMCEMFY